MIHTIILALCLGIANPPTQVGTSKTVDIKDIKAMIDKAGWLYKDGNVARSAVEVRRAQRYLEKIIRQSTGAPGLKVIKEYDRLVKAHKMLVAKGINMKPLIPLPDQAALLAAQAANQPKKGKANGNYADAAATRGDPFSKGGASSGGARSGDPFASGGSGSSTGDAGGSSSSSGRSGDPFASGGKSSSGNTSGSGASSSSGRSGDPFASGGSSSGKSSDSGASSSSGGRSGDPFSSGSSGSSSGNDSKRRGDPFSGGDSGSAGGGVSFTKEIAPILVKNCGTCHVKQSRGEFSAASYKSLIDADSVVAPNEPGDSLMIQLIEDGEMPPRGEVSSADLKKLREWIKQGAQFDGDDESAKIGT